MKIAKSLTVLILASVSTSAFALRLPKCKEEYGYRICVGARLNAIAASAVNKDAVIVGRTELSIYRCPTSVKSRQCKIVKDVRKSALYRHGSIAATILNAPKNYYYYARLDVPMSDPVVTGNLYHY